MIPLGMLAGGSGPDSIANLEFWFAASDLSGLADGAAVTTWADKSGNGRDFTCANMTVKKVTETTPKGGPIIGGSNWTAQRAPFMASAAGEIFMVVLPRNIGYNNLLRFTNNGDNDHWGWSPNYVYSHWGRSDRPGVGAIISYNTWYVLDIYTAASDWGIYLNNSLAYSTTSCTVQWGSGNHLFGRWQDNSNHYVAEVCMFSRKLTPTERTAMYAYLNGRHIS